MLDRTVRAARFAFAFVILGCLGAANAAADDPVPAPPPAVSPPSSPASKEDVDALKREIDELKKLVRDMAAKLTSAPPTSTTPPAINVPPPAPSLGATIHLPPTTGPSPGVAAGPAAVRVPSAERSDLTSSPLGALRIPPRVDGTTDEGGTGRPTADLAFAALAHPVGRETRLLLPFPSLTSAPGGGVRAPDVSSYGFDGKGYFGSIRAMRHDSAAVDAQIAAAAGARMSVLAQRAFAPAHERAMVRARAVSARWSDDRAAKRVASSRQPSGVDAPTRAQLAAARATDDGIAEAALAGETDFSRFRLSATDAADVDRLAASVRAEYRRALGAAMASEYADAYASEIMAPSPGGSSAYGRRRALELARDTSDPNGPRARLARAFERNADLLDARAMDVDPGRRAAALGRQDAALQEFDEAVRGGEEEAFTVAESARLLAGDEHSIDGIQGVTTFGERTPLFAVSAGGRAYTRAELDSSVSRAATGDKCKSADGKKDETCVKTDWGVIAAGSGKFSFVGSTANNKTFGEINKGSSHAFHKGFNVDNIAIDHDLVFGKFVGVIRGDYFQDSAKGSDRFELSSAYGELRDTIPGESLLERWIIRIGRSTIPIGQSYNTADHSHWVWGDRPVAYTHLFGDDAKLESVGLTVTHRLVVETDRFAYFRVGAYNGQDSKMTGFIGGDTIGGFTRDDKTGRYSLADIVTFGELGGTWDLQPCSCPLVVHAGAFGILGPNGTGDNGETLIWGAHARLFWLSGRKRKDTDPEHSGWVAEGEYLHRDYHVDKSATHGYANLEDWGAWASFVYAIRDPFECSDWMPGGAISLGAKMDLCGGSGDNLASKRWAITDRADRTRWSALVAWDPGDMASLLKHFTFSLEYRYDESPHQYGEKHSVYLGIQMR